MQITDIEAIPVRVPLKMLDSKMGIAPYVDAHNQYEFAKRVLIRLETDEGVTGWGEIDWSPSFQTAVTAINDIIAPEVIGRNVDEIEGLSDEFFYYYFDISPFVSGVEMAMLDAHAKGLGVPMYSLLGGKKTDSVEFAFALGILSPEESRSHVQEARDHGFDIVKTTAGKDWKMDVERIQSMYDEVDGQMEFRLDANQEWTCEEAVRVGATLEDSGIYLQYLEQPLRIDSFGSFERLRQRLRTPIAANEDTYFPRHLYHLVQRDAIDVAGLDLVAAGGLYPLKKLAAIGEEANVSLTHHCGFDLGIKTAAVLHAVASTPTINLPPDTIYYSLKDDIIKEPLRFEDGALSVPDSPGLGVTVSEEKVQNYRID
jgi:L-alanine-DL-glutamate epimerase-like enolase superfamily enzyme